MSRLIDADALKRQYEDRKRLFCRNRIEFSTLSDKDKARVDELDNCIADTLNAPTIELRCEECEAFDKTRLLIPQPERKKDTVQKFHDYQVEWLLSHCDLELEPRLEEWVVRFLHDTANCYMMEIDREEGDRE